MRSSNSDQETDQLMKELSQAIVEALTRPLTEEELARGRRLLAQLPANAEEPEHFRVFLYPPSHQ